MSREGARRGVLTALVAAAAACACTTTAGAAHKPKPDLLVTGVGVAPAAVEAGKTIGIADTTADKGKKKAKASSTTYLLSNDQSPGGADQQVGQRGVGALKPKSSSGGVATVTVPGSTAPGNLFLLACADGTGQVKEKSESNNCASTALKVSAPPAPPAPANQAPDADFSFSPGAPAAGTTVDFSSLATDGDGTVVSQAWDFDGDQDFADATGASPSHVFASPGTYRVRLRVTDDDGATSTRARDVVVAPAPNEAPDADFTFSPSSPDAGQAVNFSSQSTDADGTIVSQAWDFDGNQDFADATGASPSQAFPTQGTFTVRLRVTDDDGATDISARQVVVGNPDRDGDGAPNSADCAPDDPAIHPGAPDAPEMTFTDSNCDGVDGDASASIFVDANDPAAVDSVSAGTRAKPAKTIGFGLALAGASKPNVLVARGTYAENLSVANGRSIFGGYDPVSANQWNRSRGQATTIVGTNTAISNAARGLVAQSITTATTLQLLDIRSVSATGTGGSSYGLYVQNSNANLTLDNLSIFAGNGAPGTPGSFGPAGPDGNQGTVGGNATCSPVVSVGSSGPGGAGHPNGADGGPGGAGGRNAGGTTGTAGTAGTGAGGGTAGGAGGGGAVGVVGTDGSDGGVGADGADGAGGTTTGGVTAGFFAPDAAANGANGSSGGGGGGGGGGGSPSLSAAGGGGGGGGEAGTGGTGGGGGRTGGGSFGLFVTGGSMPTVTNSTIRAGDGGPGGLGGVGGEGGSGAGGGVGGSGCGAGGAGGGAGGAGGNGGHGGSGGGGMGGPSIAIFTSGVGAPTISPTNSLFIGAPGPGGASLGHTGANGQAQNTLFLA